MKQDYFSLYFADGEVWYARFDTENEGPYGFCKYCPCIAFKESNDTVFVVPLGLLKKQVKANFRLDAVKPDLMNGLSERRIVLYGCAREISIDRLERKCGKVSTETVDIVNAGILEHILFNLQK